MDYDTDLAQRLSGELAREMREREAITCPARSTCNWAHPDTCRLCDSGKNKTVVLAVGRKTCGASPSPKEKRRYQMNCGCRVIPETDDILYCPMHNAARELLKALKQVNNDLQDRYGYSSQVGLGDRSLAKTQRLIEEVIAQAEKQP